MKQENNDFEQDVFQEKHYIPLWYHRKYFKHFCVIGSILLILLVIIIVVFSTSSCSNVITEKARSNDNLQSKLIILVNESQLASFDPKSKNLSLLLNTTTFCPPVYNRYLDVRVDGQIACQEKRTLLQFSEENNVNQIIFDERGYSGLSFISDDVTKNLYMLDRNNGNLVVMDATKKYFHVLLSNLHDVRNVVFDQNEGLMFIFQRSVSQILRANMDGSELDKIIDGYIVALAINVNRQRLYWAGGNCELESSDYNGKNRRSVYSTSNTNPSTTFELTVLEDHLYWMIPQDRLFSCELDNHDTCQDIKVHDIGYAKTIKFIKAFSRNIPSITNPCQIDNGGCQHLCLITRNNSHSCTCQMGWQLNPDKRTCREVRDYLIYTRNNRIKVTDVSGSKDLIFPTPYTTESLEYKNDISFDYDILNDNFYYSDDFNVYKMSLKSNRINRTVIVKANDAVIDDVVYDWYTGNLYVSGRKKPSFDRHSLMILKVQETGVLRKTLHTSSYDRHSAFESCPYAIALHPSKGHVFFAGVIDAQAHICTLYLNGTRFRVTSDPFMLFTHNCPYVSVDYSTDRLYWIFATDEITMVAHSEFDGSDLTYVVVEDVSRARTVHVHQSWIYLSNRTGIWRVNKKTGKDVVRIDDGEGDGMINAMRIVSGAVQFEGRANPCRVNNGGCEEFCYAEPEVICDCQSGRTVSSDGDSFAAKRNKFK